jgi:hypothetical protein
VLEIQGDWYLNGNSSSALKRWQKLPPSATLSINAPTSDAHIVIASLSGEIIDRRSCEIDVCSRPLKLPERISQRSVMLVVFDAALELLFGSPVRYERSLHRTRTSEEVPDGVVKLDKGEIDFSPILKHTGPYYLRWRARPRSGQVGKWSSPVGLRTKGGQSMLVAASNFKAGVYEINLQRTVAGGYETFASAWVLVCASSQYRNAVASFQQAVRLTEQWDGKVESATSQQFLRAHLDYLAGQAGR